jgi:hypothetical protein
MTASLEVLQRGPEARTETVSDLVHYARQGRIRIPDFQRPLKWQAGDVVALFDSIHRGLPIGSLLLWKHKAEAARVRLGPVEVTADELAEAWWVVDGQQRITSLAASLLRPLPLPAGTDAKDPYVVYFDSENLRFEAPPKKGKVPVAWVPLPALLDAARLSEWVHEWALGADREARARVFEAGKRIREYKLPLYLVETTNRDLLREIFFRVNNTGKTLKWHEVHDALYGHQGGPPSTTTELADELASLGMGRLDGATITTSLLALRGLDVTQPLSEHRRERPDILKGAVADALPALRHALTFLKNRAGIPHLRLLPRTMVLGVLTRFFFLHPEPNARTRTLLTRWLWRTLLGGSRLDERTLERRTIGAVGDDEEASVQAMLSLVSSKRPALLELPESFDARTADTRLALLALSSLGPRDLHDERPLDVGALVEAHKVRAFGFIATKGSVHGPENRLLHAGAGAFRPLLEKRIREHGPEDEVIASHGITPDAARALGIDLAAFFTERRARIKAALEALGERQAAWGRDGDRPSLDYLLSNVPARD